MRASTIFALLAASFVAATPLGSGTSGLLSGRNPAIIPKSTETICSDICYPTKPDCGTGEFARHDSDGCWQCCSDD
ncbi:hypothetical protein BOTBODRAFT_192164 [Botryobasidium botryosum FD-172 SS1]|uniref:Uncharacterized protein n=1 Tax=Botryobasidium botryosum (strain FD-172 SS1) TaxID=930990 RepID=A0A067LWR3_BOTB1|nr:hypothetical protein BOTBODRAFT_192164 [Botryobasidium botryosum FD-172 SS1]